MPLPDAERSSANTEGSLLGGRYRLVRLIGRGPVVEVWEGHDVVLTRPVAVKVLRGDLTVSAERRERFRRESIGAARLAHVNVMATYDTGDEGGSVFLVTELMKGRPLADVLATEGPMAAERAVAVGLQVAAAIEYANRAGIVHGAVDADNVFVPDDPFAGGRVKVGDFGIGDAEPDARLTEADDARGLGRLLYQMLCGRPPVEAGEVARPRRVRPGVPRPLETVVLRAVAGEYATVGDLRRALAAVDVGPDDADAFDAPRITPPRGQPAARRGRRSWAPVIALVVLALSTVGTLAWLVDGGTNLPGLGVGSEAVTGAPLAIASVQSFDPEANPPEENEDRAPFAIDGDASTSWVTERYRGARFANLKSGVGLVLELRDAERLSRLTVRTPSRRWSARVYVAEGRGARLADWGQPVASRDAIDGDAVFNLADEKARYVLLWLTDPGAENRFAANEVVVTAS